MSTKNQRRVTRLTGKRVRTLTQQTAADTIAEYHDRYVAPLEARLAKLEVPWWRRIWRRAA